MANNSQNDQDNAKIGGVLMLVMIGSMLWFCSDDRPTKPTSTSTALSTASPNLYLSPEDLQNPTTFGAPTYYPDKSEARIICRDYAKRNAMNPATVDFDWAMPTDQMPDGRTVVTMKFTAKNSFGVPGRLEAKCTFNATEMIDGKVYEIVD